MTSEHGSVITDQSPSVPTTMRLHLAVLLLVIHCFAEACEPDQIQDGCKIYGATCSCGYGCNTEYIYKTRRACLNALRERSADVCYRGPCMRGICIQTVQDPGFACRCESTGYYGQRCEKACPTAAVRGLVFPHECIVI